MDKVKAFFANKITKIVAWCVLSLSAIALILGGVSAATISSGVELTAGVVLAIATLVAFIAEHSGKSE